MISDVNVQCCVREPCTAFSETDGGEYGQYFCLNTYKTDDCGGGSGKFVAYGLLFPFQDRVIS